MRNALAQIQEDNRLTIPATCSATSDSGKEVAFRVEDLVRVFVPEMLEVMAVKSEVLSSIIASLEFEFD